jgi:acyl-CoA reductase-like NAD-dependent aldehyde dehydrogenase
MAALVVHALASRGPSHSARRLPEGRAETYAHLITAEMGKPLPDAIAESRKPALDARHKAEEADEAYHKPQPIPRVSEQISYELVGPIFSVQPWNLPSYA